MTNAKNLETKIGALEKLIRKTLIPTINTRFDQLDDRIAKLEDRLLNVEERLTSVETRLTDVETRLTDVETRLTDVETRLTDVETRLRDTEEKLGSLENFVREILVPKMTERFDKLEEQQQKFDKRLLHWQSEILEYMVGIEERLTRKLDKESTDLYREFYQDLYHDLDQRLTKVEQLLEAKTS